MTELPRTARFLAALHATPATTEQPRLPTDVVEARLNHLIDRARRGALLPDEADRFTTELRDLVRRLEDTEDEVARLTAEQKKNDEINAKVDAKTEEQLNSCTEVAQYYKALAERTQAWGEQHRDRANRYRARSDAVRAELITLNGETAGLNVYAMAGRRDAVARIRAALQSAPQHTT